jgi:hypothetical protein
VHQFRRSGLENRWSHYSSALRAGWLGGPLKPAFGLSGIYISISGNVGQEMWDGNLGTDGTFTGFPSEMDPKVD